MENSARKFHLKIKEQIGEIHEHEYVRALSSKNLDEQNVELIDLTRKASVEKQKALQDIENEIHRLAEEKLKNEEKFEKLRQKIDKQLKEKQKEKSVKVETEEQILKKCIDEFDSEICGKKEEFGKKQAELKKQQQGELTSKGADTKRIAEIELRTADIDRELDFIEANRDKVAEYNKDKRELFDHEAEFKNQKAMCEKQLDAEKQRHEQQKSKWTAEIGVIKAEIQSLKNKLTDFEKDLEAFESFSKTKTYMSVEHIIDDFEETDKTDLSCVKLINELNSNVNANTERYGELQETINKLAGNFSENNLFTFKVKCVTREDYFAFSDNMQEFIEEHKIDEYKRRFEERFAGIIKQILP